MGNEWEPPKWQREGRTGPNGPRYASARDRALVRAGKGDQVGKEKKGCPLTILIFLALPTGFTVAVGMYFHLL